jgi:hypothetical protein
MKYVRVRLQRLAKLLRSETELQALQAGGVDNWEWYGECFTDDVEALLDADDDNLVQSQGFVIHDTEELFTK